DWFWWFGDYNDHESVRLFEKVFRENLSRLYGLMGRFPPATLNEPLSSGGQSDNLGTMRRVT
ncbi:MAG: glycoside hydrolase, partial [Pseudomonadota bacterium]|nr:glycoside hydrolase [Pseudomonadota bacterium]